MNSPTAEFIARRSGHFEILHAREFETELIANAIEIHRENDQQGREACEHWAPQASVSRVVLRGSAGAKSDFAVKWCRWRGFGGGLSDAFYGSRASRSLHGALRLSAAGVRTAEPIALAERRRFGVPVESFFVSRFLAASTPLPAALPGIAARPAERRALAYALGDLVGKLHAAGVDHPDLKHSNLLVGPGGEIAIVDLDSLVPKRHPTWHRRVRALGQLEAYATDLYPWLPRTDRARFLRAYFSHNPELRERRAALVRDVGKWVDRRLESWARRDRRGHIVFPLAPR